MAEIPKNRRGQIPIEYYTERLKKLDEQYHWPLENKETRRETRDKIHAKFPYVVTYSGYYGKFGLLDDMEEWCREQFGIADGECLWDECPQSWDTWYKNTGLEAQLDKELAEERKKNPKPDEKNKKALKKWQDDHTSHDIITKHFDMIAKLEGKPPEDHYHTGKWTAHFVMKTGYDYGYEDYCFENEEDAFYFKLMWAEEAERRA